MGPLTPCAIFFLSRSCPDWACSSTNPSGEGAFLRRSDLLFCVSRSTCPAGPLLFQQAGCTFHSLNPPDEGPPRGGGRQFFIFFFILGECGVEDAWGFLSGVFHTTLFSCFVLWRGHRVTSRNSGLRFLLPMTHCDFPAPMGSHLCRFGRPGFPTGGCLGAFDVDVTR